MPVAADFAFSTTSIDAEEVRVLRYTATEGLSQCFVYDLELASFEIAVAFEDIIGESAKLEVHTAHGQRWVHGIVARWEEIGYNRAFTYYSVRMVPLLWTLTLIRQSRIFQKMSTADIVKKVLEDAGIPKNLFRFSLQKSYEPRLYCVQYRESDYDFINRLMEEEGMFFFFEHTEDEHVLVIGDSPEVHADLPEDPILRYRESDAGMLSEETVTGFRYARTLRTGAVSLNEFDFKKPSLDLVSAEKAASNKESKFESYDYPGEYHVHTLGKRLAKVRLEEERAETYLGVGETDCRRLEAGYKFALEEHPHEELNGEYVITRVRHTGEQPHAGAGAGGAGGEKPRVYHAHFEVIPYAIPFRAPRLTPRPRIDGPQTALVVGPKGEEIHCDDLGRVKVKFHWDRSPAEDDTASCWIRVSQPSGGMGSMYIPRVGQEVVVEFLEGDPDRPLVTGRVYNAQTPPPYTLPDAKTMITVKSASSPGGDGSNEIRFEDKKGSEQVLVHAEKDVDWYVKNDVREFVGRDQHTTVARDQFLRVDRDDHAQIDRDELVEVTRDQSVKIGEKQMIAIGGSRTLTVGGNVHESYGKDYHLQVKDSVWLQAGQNIVIEAGQQITLKVGGNFVTIDASGVTTKGTMIKLNSGGSPGTGKKVKAVPTVKPKKSILAQAAAAAANAAVSGSHTESSKATSDNRPTHKNPPKDAPADPTKTWVEFVLTDASGNPVPGEPYEVELPNKKITTGTTDGEGLVRIEGVDPGNVKVRFPRRDKAAWKKA